MNLVPQISILVFFSVVMSSTCAAEPATDKKPAKRLPYTLVVPGANRRGGVCGESG